MSGVDPVEAVEKVRESLMRADAQMKPGSANMGRALAHLGNAIQALADGLESIAGQSTGGMDAPSPSTSPETR